MICRSVLPSARVGTTTFRGEGVMLLLLHGYPTYYCSFP